ncbi:MAG: lectin [Vicinamibacterales bacterium]
MVYAQGRGGPPQPMSFFVTSVGKGDGANYGGLAGADAHCQALAAAVGRGNATWRAYLSTQGAGAVNARDRIGNGPWFNARGQQIAANVAELHGDTLEQARMGNRINKVAALNEKGEMVNGVGDQPNQHDILTGSMPDGRAYTDGADHTCNNYTSNANVEAPARGQGGGGGGARQGGAQAPAGPSVQLGHHDRLGGGNASWNSVHASRGCSQPNLVATGGAGLLYCFAVGN